MPSTPNHEATATLIARLEAGDADALARLVDDPLTVLRLAEHSRAWWYVRRGTLGDGSPTALALASIDHDGHLREAAVRAIADRPVPELAPFLVLRTGDWVPQVREPARQVLDRLLAAHPLTYVRAVLPIALRTARQFRTGYAIGKVRELLPVYPEDVRRELAASRYPALRREAFEAGIAHGRLTEDQLLTLALRESEPAIRQRAAEALTDVDSLRALTTARSAGVRAVGYSGLSRAGLNGEVIAALTEQSALIRALARDAARRAGVDAAAVYRAGLPALGAIAGLAELRHTADAELLKPLLAHADGAVRAAAVRGLAQLDAVQPEEVLPLLHDPAAAVVREASLALRAYAGRLPDGFREALLSDPRPEVRFAGFRLAGREKVERLRLAALLALDPDPALAERGRTSAIAFMHWARRDYRGAILSTPARRDALVGQIERSRDALGGKTDTLLDAVRNAVAV